VGFYFWFSTRHCYGLLDALAIQTCCPCVFLHHATVDNQDSYGRTAHISQAAGHCAILERQNMTRKSCTIQIYRCGHCQWRP